MLGFLMDSYTHTHTFAVSLGKAHAPQGAFVTVSHSVASDWLREDVGKRARLLLPPSSCACVCSNRDSLKRADSPDCIERWIHTNAAYRKTFQTSNPKKYTRMCRTDRIEISSLSDVQSFICSARLLQSQHHSILSARFVRLTSYSSGKHGQAEP